ncbi:hypothetical protein GX48_05222 [Paracoccidioides brasiliensis]|nr:hypothetical protein GX48_05222 [Paracoccidioides brasiliensis]
MTGFLEGTPTILEMGCLACYISFARFGEDDEEEKEQKKKAHALKGSPALGTEWRIETRQISTSRRSPQKPWKGGNNGEKRWVKKNGGWERL